MKKPRMALLTTVEKRRLYKYYILQMSGKEIAEQEGVSEQAVSESITNHLKKTKSEKKFNKNQKNPEKGSISLDSAPTYGQASSVRKQFGTVYIRNITGILNKDRRVGETTHRLHIQPPPQSQRISCGAPMDITMARLDRCCPWCGQRPSGVEYIYTRLVSGFELSEDLRTGNCICGFSFELGNSDDEPTGRDSGN